MKKKLCLLLALMLVLAVPLTACGGSEQPANQPAGQDGEQPAEKSVLKIGIKDEPDSLSPFIATLYASGHVTEKIYDTLIEYDNDLNPRGRLAESWSVSEDGLEWTFNLRKEIKWFDGEDFTADDVVWTYNALLSAEFPQSIQLNGVTKVEKVNEYTVKLYTEIPKADMEGHRILIMPEHIYNDKSLDELNTFAEENPVGTGIFKLVEWKQGEYIRLKKNENYFQGPSNIDEIVYVIFANTDTLMQALQAGEIDATINVAKNQVNMLEQDPNIEVVTANGRNFTELGFNCWEDEKSLGNPLVLDPKIRVACDYAIDKEQIVKIALNGFGTSGTTLIPASVGDWHWDPGDDEHKYDPQKAKEILEAAGYTDTDGDGIREDADGNKLSFRFAVISKTDAYVKASGIIQKNLQDIGVEVVISTMDSGAQSDLIYEKNFDTDMYLWGWGCELDPTLKLSVLTTDQIGKRSDCFWGDETYDELFELQSTQVNRAERLETVHEMQKIAYEKAPYIILYSKNSLEAYRTDKFEGWTRIPEGIGTVLDQLNHSTLLNLKVK